ncbi:MAG: ATP-binding protein [Polyangiales bacterium]
MSSAQAEAREGLERLASAVDHAKELLDVHRRQSQLGGESRARVATVAEALSSLQAMVSVDLASRGGRFDLDVSPAARTQQVDGLLLVRALVNGARNALDAFDAEPAGVPPRLTLRVELDDDQLLFVLVDNGPGFEGAGEQFFEDGRTTRARGSGLGLGSARRAIESLGGRVRLTSPGPGRGAEFLVSLPLRPGETS